MSAKVEVIRKKVVVVGNGMVGHRFCKKLRELDSNTNFELIVYGEEPRAAYDRVQLTSYFSGNSVEDLTLDGLTWYQDNEVTLHVSKRITAIDRDARTVTVDDGTTQRYDYLVLATGSAPFVPPIDGVDKEGVFVYRTIEDLDAIKAYAETAETATVIGGGLLGLEAAKAVVDLGLDVHVVEFAPRLMPRQLDDEGSKLLVREIEALGVKVLLKHQTKRIEGNGSITGLTFMDDALLDTDMLIVSAGIRPRDELAREAGLAMGERGGVIVDDTMQTSDPTIFAIGELALHDGMIYGLVGPGYQMADTLAENLMGNEAHFTGADMSTKLKLMGVEVASLGSIDAEGPASDTVVVKDTVSGVYKKIILSEDRSKLLGGILVGDTSDYSNLLHTYRSLDGIVGEPKVLLLGSGGDGAAAGVAALPDDAQVCSCNNVSKGDICSAIRKHKLSDLGDVQSATCAGTGCGGCVPMVKDILAEEFKRAGVEVKKIVCAHFPLSRQELFHSVKVKKLQTFRDVLTECGTGGEGCEVCKPVVGSILASLWNDHIVEHATIQDTNDRFLANIQRGGTYSVVPRVPGGEITPDKLIVLGQVAKKYDLYCKITGGQRVDLLGARIEQLPDIWEELIIAGFESGHAYGKSLRTVKSCVGQTWCRYGVQDSTKFAIDLEERYRGVRSPHKLKMAVSGCVRECAEAQCKDVGLIATDKGWNLYLCGNGGAKPRHADLFASEIDTETAILYIDRFLMYYIHTADPLQRTSVWLEKLEGGLDHVKDVVINDSLGLCETLEADMARLIDTYQCEWASVVNNPEKRALFRHFANADEADPSLGFVEERTQKRPEDWPATEKESLSTTWSERSWWKAGRVGSFPKEGGMAVTYGGVQLAVFRYGVEDTWYATQNMCPHKQDMVLARGLLGDKGGVPKVACPMHKKQFSLEDGSCVSGDNLTVATFDVKVTDGFVYLHLPPAEELAEAIGQDKGACAQAC